MERLKNYRNNKVNAGDTIKNVLIEAAKILYNDFIKFDENKSNNKDKGKIKGTELISKETKKEKGKCC